MTNTTSPIATETDRDSLFENALNALRSEKPKPTPHWVDGEEVREGEILWREDPCHPDQIVSGCHDAPDALVERAITAARRAAPAWDALGPAARVELLAPALKALDDRRLAQIAATNSLETGKSRVEGFVEAEELRVLMERYCAVGAEADAFEDPLEPANPKAASQSLLRPFGVFGVIAPFNYPTVLGAGPAIAALIAGNAVVLKPPQQGPRSAYEFIDLLQECDLPAGVINLVNGGDAPGKALVGGDVDGIAFTGSYAAGMAIYRAMQSGPYPRPVIAEMGGSNPVVVTDSADLERAADGILISAYGLSGQRCSACSRVIVTEGAHDELAALLAEGASKLKVGDPIDRDTFLGPLIGADVVEVFDRAVEEGNRDGKVLVGGNRVDDVGYAVEPTIIAELPRGHRLTREELFMPLITVTKVPDFKEAVVESNDTELGLTAGIYTGDADEAREYLLRAEAGCVDVNVPGAATTGWWPGNQTFGGWKGSGSTGKQAFGRWYVQQFARERCQSIATDFEL
jgi:1-pyrroline-5-carboxylate dehydrogenase